MIFLFLFIVVIYLRRTLHKLDIIARNNIKILIMFAIIGMVAYELYVEYAVGWQYGVPYDDDTGWVFRAATAIRNGGSWDRLYLVALDADWNDSRVLSLTTLGQYLYATFVAISLYYPVAFSVRFNLYFIYVLQILLISGAIIDCYFALGILCAAPSGNKRPPKTEFFFLMLFYPIVLFNTYKTLRETFFIFFSLKLFAEFVQTKGGLRQFRKLILYSLCLIIIRPHAIVLVFSIIVWILFGERMAVTSGLVVSLTIIFGSTIVSKITQILGWNYGFSSVKVPELVHLLLFPDPVSQTKNLLQIGQKPSWVTLLYFAQSLWNIPILGVCILGIVNSIKRKNNLVWIVVWLNSLMIYSLAYSIENMTPRYKLIYLIPQMVYLYIGLVRLRTKFRWN